ncbi:unnamed protein product [Vicia faba]|uniref:Uncharacterized protein n=1 Tax=Vicia faba TaxID=3906 RepID=A0AAV1A5V2_VICFA|nr:unnamed protein product [Vicia faba]
MENQEFRNYQPTKPRIISMKRMMNFEDANLKNEEGVKICGMKVMKKHESECRERKKREFQRIFLHIFQYVGIQALHIGEPLAGWSVRSLNGETVMDMRLAMVTLMLA